MARETRSETEPGTERYDVVVVGGGAAGLSGAVTLARARRSVLVIDEGRPRNAPADGVHGYLGREGTPPGELVAAGREELRGYGGLVRQGTAVAAERRADGFVVRLADGGEVAAARLLVTTGLADGLPELPGLAAQWGRGVLHCPYCHGWEVRDDEIGVLSTGPFAVHQALMWRQWSERITLFRHTGPELDAEQREQLAARGVVVVEGEVTEVVSGADGRMFGLRLADGHVVPCRAMTVTTRLAARGGGLLESLGLEAVEQERDGHVFGTHFAADPVGASAVPGVWLAGNVTGLMDQVVAAAAAGVRAGAAINADLTAEETSRAVAAYRAGREGEHGMGEHGHGHGHQHGHGQQHGQGGAAVEEFWDGRYGESERIWSGNPNPTLVREAAELTPGRALDLGCGEGADALWLAERGWTVTATDVSKVALERAAEHAAAAGPEVAARIDWQRHDFGVSFPEGEYELVSAHFLHSPVDVELDREAILRSAAAAVAVGGVLLVVGHYEHPSWAQDRHPGMVFPTTDEVLAALRLPDGDWTVERSQLEPRDFPAPDGTPGTRTDNLLRVRRVR
ncbi:FAD-dependent oxidoreductase [Kitasatospora sp. NPDC004289]